MYEARLSHLSLTFELIVVNFKSNELMLLQFSDFDIAVICLSEVRA